jgi:hypothetical protein
MMRQCSSDVTLRWRRKAWAAQRYPVTGLVLKIDRPHRSFVASCKAIPGYMDAMVMPIPVRDEKALDALKPSALVDFTLVVTKDDAYAENLRVRQYQSAELEPLQARRLQLLEASAGGFGNARTGPWARPVPDFTLADQTGRASVCRNSRARCWCPHSFIQVAPCRIIASGCRTIWAACKSALRTAWDATWYC